MTLATFAQIMHFGRQYTKHHVVKQFLGVDNNKFLFYLKAVCLLVTHADCYRDRESVRERESHTDTV